MRFVAKPDLALARVFKLSTVTHFSQSRRGTARASIGRGGGSAFAAVVDLEFVAGVGGEERGDVTKALGEGGGVEEWIFTLAEVAIVEVDGEREHVDGERVGEGGFEKGIAGALVDGGFSVSLAGIEGAAARLPGVLAGFATHLRFGLRPGEAGEAVRDAGDVDKVVGDIDEELEGQAEAVFDEAGGEEDGLGGSERRVTMANGAVAELDVVGGGDEVFAGVGDGEGHEVVGSMAKGLRERGGNGADEALEIGVGDAGLSPGGVADAVGGLLGGHLRSDLAGVPQLNLRTAGHEFVFYSRGACRWSEKRCEKPRERGERGCSG